MKSKEWEVYCLSVKLKYELSLKSSGSRSLMILKKTAHLNLRTTNSLSRELQTSRKAIRMLNKTDF